MATLPQEDHTGFFLFIKPFCRWSVRRSPGRRSWAGNERGL